MTVGQWQKLEIPFTGGLDEKAQAEAGTLGSFAVLLNLVQNNDGAYTKVPGLRRLTKTVFGGVISGGTLAAGNKLFAHRDALCLIDGSWLYTYSPTATQWMPIDRVPEMAVSKLPLVGVQARPKLIGACYASGFYVVGWTNNESSAFLRVVDATTGAAVSSDVPVGTTGQSPRIKMVAIAPYAYCFYRDGAATGTLKYIRIDLSASTLTTTGGTVPNATNLETTTPIFDVVAGTTQIYIAYANNSATPPDHFDVRQYNTSIVQQSTRTIAAAAAINTLGIGGLENDQIWIAWHENAGDVKAVGLSPVAVSSAITSTAASVFTPTGAVPIGTIGVLGLGGGEAHLMASGSASTYTFWQRFVSSGGAVVPVASMLTAFDAKPVSRQFLMNGRVYALWQHVDQTALTTTQNTAALVDITYNDGASYELSTIPKPVACPSPRLTQPPHFFLGNTAYLVHPVSVSATVIGIPMLTKTTTSTGLTTYAAASIDMVRYDFGASNRWQTAVSGASTIIGGGQPYFFDGRALCEVGFWASPDAPTLADHAAGNLPAGTYLARVIYEQIDNTGAVHWSSPSPVAAVALVLGANRLMYVNTKSLQVTARGATSYDPGRTVRLVAYISKDGGNFFRSPDAPTINDPTVNLQNISVSNYDESQPLLYTESGALARQMPPPLAVVAEHEDRTIGVDETGANVWFTGQLVSGEAQWWQSEFQYPIVAAGPLLALASMEGRQYAFSRSQVFYIDGDGPPDVGGNFFSLPHQLPTRGVGCVEPRSVVVAEAGIFFYSEQGIYLLSRGGEVQYIGRGVEQSALAANFGPVTSAVLRPSTGKVYFTLQYPGTDVGEVLVYDSIHGVWSQIVQRDGTTIVAPVSSAMVGGTIQGSAAPVWYCATRSGQVYQETADDFLVNASTYQHSAIFTSWIKLDGEQGYARVRGIGLLSERLTGHDVKVQLYYDYDDGTPVDTRTFTAAELVALVTTKQQIGVDCSRQKMEAIKVAIQDLVPSSGTVGTGQGCTFIGLAITAQIKGGKFRLPTANEK